MDEAHATRAGRASATTATNLVTGKALRVTSAQTNGMACNANKSARWPTAFSAGVMGPVSTPKSFANAMRAEWMGFGPALLVINACPVTTAQGATANALAVRACLASTTVSVQEA